MSFTLQTILHIKASRAIGDTLVRLPTVSSTVRMSDGSSYSAIDELSPSHIQMFYGFQTSTLRRFSFSTFLFSSGSLSTSSRKEHNC
jgi:hypothetical protein